MYTTTTACWLLDKISVAVSVCKLANPTEVSVSSVSRWQASFSCTCSGTLCILWPVWHRLLARIHLNRLAAWLVRQRLEVSRIVVGDRLVLTVLQSCDQSFIFIAQLTAHQRRLTDQHHVLSCRLTLSIIMSPLLTDFKRWLKTPSSAAHLMLTVWVWRTLLLFTF